MTFNCFVTLSLTVLLYNTVTFHIITTRITGPISTKLGTKSLSIDGNNSIGITQKYACFKCVLNTYKSVWYSVQRFKRSCAYTHIHRKKDFVAWGIKIVSLTTFITFIIWSVFNAILRLSQRSLTQVNLYFNFNKMFYVIPTLISQKLW